MTHVTNDSWVTWHTSVTRLICRTDDVIIENDFVKHEKSKDFQKNPEEESLASEIGMLEIDEITMKVSFMLLDVITWLSFLVILGYFW